MKDGEEGRTPHPETTTLVELAACWTRILLATGPFLWWPKQARFSPWGILLPRLLAGGRTFWKDIHAGRGAARGRGYQGVADGAPFLPRADHASFGS